MERHYFEVHYMLDPQGDVEFISEYRGKAMRQCSTAERAVAKLKKDKPTAFAIEIAEYDESGRIG